jgi:hypothetical protein
MAGFEVTSYGRFWPTPEDLLGVFPFRYISSRLVRVVC